jgi:uncharacterized protein YndB with AHSA1/START domain
MTDRPRAYEATITIHAPAERVWSILTEASRYPTWNTTIDRLDGTIAPGRKLKIFAKIAPGRAFSAKVSEFRPSRAMVWSYAAPLGFFRGARSFTIDPQGDHVIFRTREEFGGWLAGPIIKKMPDLQPSFDEFARCLKAEAEAA